MSTTLDSTWSKTPSKSSNPHDKYTSYFKGKGEKEKRGIIFVPPSSWTSYFLALAKVVASRSRCASRQIGCVLVKENRIIACGYNGSPSKVSLCHNPNIPCFRREMGFLSGKGLEFCPAVHAELNAVINAARVGTSTNGAIAYMTCGIPCKDCMGAFINAGISKVVCSSPEIYDDLSVAMAREVGLIIQVAHEEPKDS